MSVIFYGIKNDSDITAYIEQWKNLFRIKQCERPMSWLHFVPCSPVSSASRSTLHSVLKTERQMMSVPHGSNQNACDGRLRNTPGFNII